MKLKLHVFWYRKLFLDLKSDEELNRIVWIGSFLMIFDIILSLGLLALGFVLFQLYNQVEVTTKEIIYIILAIVGGIVLLFPLFFIFVPGLKAVFYERLRREKELLKRSKKSKK
ncbi:MAG: hypothetical protein ACTSUR_02525 [Candidatus Heimdallarchaeaceae archaeon]